jgi:Bacterial capsule synthesis protein PGA_cap
MPSFVQTFLLIILSIVSYYYFSQLYTTTTEINPQKDIINKEDSISTATITIVGDLMCHSVQIDYAYVEKDSFDFNGVFSEVKEYLSSADFTIGNLETVLAGKEKGYSGYPFFNAPDDFLEAIYGAGFDLLITANNHALDQGIIGVNRTIEKMDELGLDHTGTYLSQNDRDSIRIYSINGIQLGVIAYSYGTNGVPIPGDKNYIINLIDFNLIEEDINKARNEGAEIVLAFYHFGEEYEREPNIYQRDVVNNTIKAGADIIIGSHPHVVQPVNYFNTNGGSLDTGFVAYSLGNFISNQRWRFSDAGVILNIRISKDIKRDSVYLSDISYIPTWVFKGKTKKGKEFIILPATKFYNDSINSYLTSSDKEKMHQAFKDTKFIISKYNSKTGLISP